MIDNIHGDSVKSNCLTKIGMSMDNLSHAAFGATIGAVIAPELAEKHKLRFLLTSALLANLPDIDILYLLGGQKAYYFHHRGLTHSLFGLVFLLPLGVLILNKFFFKKSQDPTLLAYRLPFKVAFVAAQFLFGHFLLDYLTAYGTMFLYPLSWARFSFPLMFIIDPLFWLISLVGIFFIYRQCNSPSISYKMIRRKRACAVLLGCLVLWTVELAFKKTAQARYLSKVSYSPDHLPRIQSYPAPFAPVLWFILDSHFDNHSKDYIQATVSFLKNETGSTILHDLPRQMKQGSFCDDQIYSPTAIQSFQQFERWGEHIACAPYQWQDINGCRCLSLKYSVAALNVITFGGFFITPKGDSWFLPADGRGRLLEFYSKILFDDGSGWLSMLLKAE